MAVKKYIEKKIPIEDIIITYRHMNDDSKVVQTDFVPQLALFCPANMLQSLRCVAKLKILCKRFWII